MEERRFYVLAIQYNRQAEAENRTAPKAFNSYNDAKKEFHNQLSKDMGNATLGWSLCMIIDNFCNVIDKERYVADPPTVIEE